MDSTLLRAGRTTHLKIVVIALVASIAVVAVGINARTINVDTASAPINAVVKAGQPVSYAGQEAARMR